VTRHAAAAAIDLTTCGVTLFLFADADDTIRLTFDSQDIATYKPKIIFL